MRKLRNVLKAAAVGTLLTVTGLAGPNAAHAAQPQVTTNHGAFVRLVGNPADGTAKFQFGWAASTDASAAAGYWVGLYDVTHSTYVWNNGDTGPIDLPDALTRNAQPTADLSNGEYKVVFFVRGAYGPPTNIAELEVPFTVTNMMG